MSVVVHRIGGAVLAANTFQSSDAIAIGSADFPAFWFVEVNNPSVAIQTGENRLSGPVDGAETKLSTSTRPEMWPAIGNCSEHLFSGANSGQVNAAKAKSSNRSDQNDDQMSRGPDLEHFPNSNLELKISDIKLAELTTASGTMAEGAEFEVVEGSRFNRNIAKLTKPNNASGPADFVASIDWGDDMRSDGSIIDDGSQFRVAGSHIYDSPGVYQVCTRIRGLLGLEYNANGQITVRDASLHATGRVIRAVAGREFRCVLALFRDRNPFSKVEDFSVRIRWGDGAISHGEISANLDGGFDIYGTHTFHASGKFFAELTLASRGGSTTIAFAIIRVEAAPAAPVGLCQSPR